MLANQIQQHIKRYTPELSGIYIRLHQHMKINAIHYISRKQKLHGHLNQYR